MWPFRKRKKRDNVYVCGVPMRIVRETRWSREYLSKDKREGYVESRFIDGTATITLNELRRDWHRWSDHEKLDFCQSLAQSLPEHVPDRGDILRFLIKNGDHYTWSAIARPVALELPVEESLPTLQHWCYSSDVGRGANYFQAVAQTKAPEALGILKTCFDRIRNAEGLMDDADFCNWVAYDATCCLEYMLTLGESTEARGKAYERLKGHPCERTREQIQQRLSDYFEDTS